jgi:hypothetical protein
MNEQIANTVNAISQAVDTSSKISFSFDQIAHWALVPCIGIATVQNFLFNFIFASGNIVITVLKVIVFRLPILLIIVGLWTTLVSLYSLVFRGVTNVKFITTLVLAWWDILTSIWNFWAGMGRLVFLSFGWAWELIKLTIGAILVGFIRVITLPFKGASEIARRYSQGGVPWVAVTITLAWCVLEAVIFTYTLLPTITEVLADLTGLENQGLIVPFLFLFLFLLISGSFACLYVLIEAFKTKKFEQIFQMVLVELFVLFFEVTFLYRELVDSLTPWIAQQSGNNVHIGMVPTLLIAGFLWAGIRGMTWFLFARFGTPTLIAVISRQKMEGERPAETRKEILQETWENFVGVFKNNMDWFNETGKKFLEAVSLPVFQIFAGAINMLIVLVTGKMLFNLPFKSLDQVMDTRELLAGVFKKKEG